MHNKPLNILDALLPELARVFDDERTGHTIPVNVYKKQDAIVYEFALYGFNKTDVSVEAIDSHLVILATTPEVEKETQPEVIKYEYTEFSKVKEASRKVSVPKEYDLSKVSAEFNNGILKVSVSLKDKKEPVKVSIN